MLEVRPPGRLRFGVFEVDLRSGELFKRGIKVRLQEQPFQVLAMLLERPGEVVSRDELRSRLWSADTFVDFDHGVNKAVNRIREALGDSASSPRFIETVTRRGYRFIGDVVVLEEPSADRQAAGPPEVSEPGGTPGVRRWAASQVLVVTALVLVTASAAALLVGRPRRPDASSIRSLAVLPLANLSGDASQEYFADGMTDELITTLGQISALRVISRTSAMLYKGAPKPLAQIARELDVDAVVEGAVVRAGSRVRITAELVDARVDRHLWSRSFDGELRDALTLQRGVAEAIAMEIRATLNPRERATLRRAVTVDPEAYEAYLKGRYFWNRRTGEDFRKASEYFSEAIARDPRYAAAFSGLADTYALMGDWEYGVLAPTEALPRSKAAAMKALEIDPALAEAHTSLAFLHDAFDWDLTAADAEFMRALELNPGYATAHHWYAWHLSLKGRTSDAVREMRVALRLDPLSLIINAELAELLLMAHDVEGAIGQSRLTLEMDPRFALAHNQLGVAYLASHRTDEAIAELQRAVQLSQGSATCTANLARAWVAAGKRGEATRVLHALERASTSGYSNAAEIATVQAALGDSTGAMASLETAYAERFNPSVLLRPGFDPLRADPRFRQLERRVGMPQ